MLSYLNYACNDYNCDNVMSADLDEYLEDNKLNLFDLNYTDCLVIAYELSGLEQKSYTCNEVESAICLANNYFYVCHLTEEQVLDKSLYFDNPELCDCYVRYLVMLEIIDKRIEEHSR